MGAFGRTKAPRDSLEELSSSSGTRPRRATYSWILGVLGDEGFAPRTTLAKWVGTATFGGDPITS